MNLPPMIMLLLQSFVCLLGCCSRSGVFAGTESFQSGHFTGDIGVRGEDAMIDGLDGVRTSDDVKELRDEFELLLDMLQRPEKIQ